MIITYVALMLAIVFVVTMNVHTARQRDLATKKKVAIDKKKAEYSTVGDILIRKFMALPESNRPSYDIKALMTDLDGYHGIDAVNRHFSIYSGTMGWTCKCFTGTYSKAKRTCQFIKYSELFDAIQGIEREIRTREQKLASLQEQERKNGLKPSLSQLDELTTALREEKTIIAQITREKL